MTMVTELSPLCFSTVSDTLYRHNTHTYYILLGYLQDFELNKQIVAVIEKSCVTKNYSIVFANCENETTIFPGHTIKALVMCSS